MHLQHQEQARDRIGVRVFGIELERFLDVSTALFHRRFPVIPPTETRIGIAHEAEHGIYRR